MFGDSDPVAVEHGKKWGIYDKNGRLIILGIIEEYVRSTQMPKQKYDLNDNGKIDPDERQIMLEDRRRMMEDADAKRDAQLRMTWFALSGMLAYPLLIVLASWLGLEQASNLLADIAAVYVVAVSGVTAAYFGFTNMGGKGQ